MHDPAQVTVNRGVLVGVSGPEVCNACTVRTRGLEMTGLPGGPQFEGSPGCPPKITRKSYNPTTDAFGPSRGLVSATFALAFTPGPDR